MAPSAPTPKQIAAVRKVLYERKRLRQIVEHGDSIVALMNLNPRLQTGRPGLGPQWFVPATGKVSPSVLGAADRCDRIADLLLEMRAELAGVDLPRSDRQHLRAGLAEQAAALRRRGSVWRSPTLPENVDSLVAPITAHERASIRELQHVTGYLHTVDLPGLRR